MQPSQLKTAQLQYFLDVAETGSFTKAAEKNYTSQSNVSYAIRELEKTLQVPLFLRKNSELSMTKYGQEFLPYVQRAFAELEQGCSMLEGMANPDSGSVKVAFSFIFSLSAMPDLFRYIFLASARDDVQLDLQPVMAHINDNIQCVEDLLLDGTCELGLTCVRVRDEIASVVVGQQEHVLLLPKNHPLAGAEKLSLQDVADEPFVLLNGDTEITGNWYKNIFDAAGVVPKLVHAGMDWLSLLVEVSAGRCLTVAPRSNLSGYDIATVSLDHPMKNRDVHLAWPTNRKLSRAGLYAKEQMLKYYEEHNRIF